MAVGSQDDEVLDVRAVELDPAVHRIIEPRAGAGTLKRTRARLAGGVELRTPLAGQRQARAVVSPRLAALLGALALLAQPLG